MKTKFNFRLVMILTLTFITFSLTNAIAQEKTKKQLKEEAKIEKQKQTALLVDSKEFIFEANRVMPQQGKAINLTSGDTAEFYPDLIKCNLPFFGRAYSGAGYGGDGGMKFEGKPMDLSIENKNKSYVIKMKVKGNNDTYSISLTVYSEGTAYLSISSNNRSSISYQGAIEAFPKK